MKTCKICSSKRYAAFSLCFKHHFEKIRKRKEEKKLKKMAKKENNPRLLKKKLDIIFSQYIRRRVADKNGKITCVCCKAILNWQDAQNMHYVGRANLSTRWDERNCNAGCMRCNVFLNGNYPQYTAYLLEQYGEEWLKRLIVDGKRIKKWTVEELKAMIEKYSNLLKTL